MPKLLQCNPAFFVMYCSSYFFVVFTFDSSIRYYPKKYFCVQKRATILLFDIPFMYDVTVGTYGAKSSSPPTVNILHSLVTRCFSQQKLGTACSTQSRNFANTMAWKVPFTYIFVSVGLFKLENFSFDETGAVAAISLLFVNRVSTGVLHTGLHFLISVSI